LAERGGLETGGKLKRGDIALNQIDLANRVAVVTGGAQGIGFAAAKRIYASGAKIALWDLDAKQLEEARSALGEDVLCETLDLTVADDVAEAANRTARQFGRIDILVTSAGIAGSSMPVASYSVDEWKRVVDVDLNAVFLCCRAVVPGMIERPSHRQHSLDRRKGGQSERRSLLGGKGGRDRPNQIARQGIGDA
jgi:NAD(P)-dependent dehydrogenase (short-subunit alcohol dehydrogenase family)